MRRPHSMALGAALVVLGSGCQLVTGSYTTDSPGPGPNCAKLAHCCSSLDSTEGPICLSAVEKENESLCSTTLTGLPTGACTGSSSGADGGAPHSDGGGVHPDGSTPPGDAFVPDSLGSKDSPGPADSVVPHDATSNLDGAWTLTGATCEGNPLTLESGTTTTLTFKSGSATEIESVSDGCVVSFQLMSVTVSATDILATQGTIICGSLCSTSDGCTGGTTGALDFPYTLSGGTLGLSESVDTSTCASGIVVFLFTM